MREIHELPERIWRRIAAGEVVERPASAVKELVENSLDAGAKNIRVRLWDGGKLRITVEDDASGIDFDDLPLALTYHATSKISRLEDLERISTLGYRGEALASLAAVADVEIRSRVRNSETGGLIKTSDGRIIEHAKVNCNPGTRIQVENLFASLPARRKFLKTASAELRRASVFLREYAVCNPDVAFSLEHDGKKIFDTDGSGNTKKILEKLWGTGAEIQASEISVGNLHLKAWFQHRPELKTRSDVMSFVNSRAVNDPVIKGALSQAAREISGNWALFFTLNPALVDVNIHPTKSEVRFRYPNEIFEAIRKLSEKLGSPPPLLDVTENFQPAPVRENFSSSRDFSQRYFPKRASASDFTRDPASDSAFSRKLALDFENDTAQASNPDSAPDFARDPASDSAFSRKLALDFEHDTAPASNPSYAPDFARNPASDSSFSRKLALDFEHDTAPASNPDSARNPASDSAFARKLALDFENDTAQASNPDSAPNFARDPASDSSSLRKLIPDYVPTSDSELEFSIEHDDFGVEFLAQTSSGYLIFDAHDDVILVDPHAAHERVNYERIRKLAENSQNVQKLLVPIILPPTLAIETVEFQEALEKSGFEFDFTTKGIALKSVPSISVEKIEPEVLLRVTLSALKNYHDGNVQDILWRTWATAACKASVKLTGRLSREEAVKLWADLCKCEQPFVCPHGRPTILKITRQDFARHFGRE